MPAVLALCAVFFRFLPGNEPVREWLKDLPKTDRRLGEDNAYVQSKWPIGKPPVDHVRGLYLGSKGEK